MCYIKVGLKMLHRDKHSSFLGPFVSYTPNEVLWICILNLFLIINCLVKSNGFSLREMSERVLIIIFSYFINVNLERSSIANTGNIKWNVLLKMELLVLDTYARKYLIPAKKIRHQWKNTTVLRCCRCLIWYCAETMSSFLL